MIGGICIFFGYVLGTLALILGCTSLRWLGAVFLTLAFVFNAAAIAISLHKMSSNEV